MSNENNNSTNAKTEGPNLEDLDAIINNMSSINSEDYWFTKVSDIQEHDEKAP